MPKRLATGPMLMALLFAVIAVGLVAVPYFEPTFTLGGNASLLAVIASVAMVLMLLLAVIIGARKDDEDDEELTDEDLVPSVAFGPHAHLTDSDSEVVLSRKERKALKQQEKQAKKDAQRQAKFEKQAQKDAEKARKKAAKKGVASDDDSDWLEDIKNTPGSLTVEPAADEEILETTSFQVPPPVEEGDDVDLIHAATASPMFDDEPDTDSEDPDDWLTAAYHDPSFEIPYGEYGTAPSIMDSEQEIEETIMDTTDATEAIYEEPDMEMTTEEYVRDEAPTSAVSSRLEALAAEMQALLAEVTVEADELRAHATEMADRFEDEKAAMVAGLHEARAEVDRLNDEYAAINSDKRDSLGLRSLLVEAENKAMRAEIDREQMLARLRQVRFSAADGADIHEIVAILDKAFEEVNETLSDETEEDAHA